MNNDLQQLRFIVPNLDEKRSRCKAKRNLLIALAPLGFVMFGLGGALTGILGEFAFIAIAILGFIFVPLGVLGGVFMSTRLGLYNYYSSVAEVIKSEDKLLLKRLMQNMAANDLFVEKTVEKLIETGNLKGYKIVGNIMVVREDIYISEENAKEELKEYLATFYPMVNNPIETKGEGE